MIDLDDKSVSQHLSKWWHIDSITSMHSMRSIRSMCPKCWVFKHKVPQGPTNHCTNIPCFPFVNQSFLSALHYLEHFNLLKVSYSVLIVEIQHLTSDYTNSQIDLSGQEVFSNSNSNSLQHWCTEKHFRKHNITEADEQQQPSTNPTHSDTLPDHSIWNTTYVWLYFFVSACSYSFM